MINYSKYLNRYKSKIRCFIKNYQQKSKLIKIAAVIITIAVAFVFFADYGEKEKIKVPNTSIKADLDSEENHKEKIDENDNTKEIIVDISGCINNPGVYYVPLNSRLCDIIKLAGGLTQDANINAINQAEKVSDGQKLYIPSANENSDFSGASTSGNPLISSNGKININTATFDELQVISGIGPATAASIVEYRTNNGRFTCIEDIKNVNGIGEKTFDKLKDQITV